MKIIKFEGTEKEFESAIRLFEDQSNIEKVENSGASDQVEDESAMLLARKAAYKAMLTRIPIPDGQMEIYKLLSRGKLTFPEYLRLLNKSSGQIAGVHGALGRRINNTKEITDAGLPGNLSAISTWQQEGGVYYQGLKPEFIEVLKEEGII